VSSAIQRPVFFENQILGAADLTATVNLGRGQQARHNRYLHLWGIAAGLELTSEPDPDRAGYVKIKLSPGVAIDGTGREIIVSQDEDLSEAQFSQSGISSGRREDELYPVFLVGRDQKATQAPLLMGACTNNEATRVEEAYEINFGRPGEEREPDEQTGVGFSDGPGDGHWQVLLGFVKWKDGFTGLQPDNNKGVGKRFVGVQADVVAAHSGSLQLRTQTKSQDKKPALILDETGDGLLRFGALNAEGKLNTVFSVNAKGDLRVEGKISSPIAPGSVQVQSGIVMDGLLLPLPPDIDPADIDSGKLMLHVHLTPLMTQDFAPGPPEQAVAPIECFVDSDRRVHCRLLWMPSSGAWSPLAAAGFCNYLVMVSAPERPES
jgi:hypothetical protein